MISFLKPSTSRVMSAREVWQGRVLSAVTHSTLRNCDANVFLGKHLLDVAREDGSQIPNAVVIPVGASSAAFPDAPPVRLTHEPRTILYCGNLGRMHETQTLIGALRDGARRLAGKYRFLFHSTGPGLEAFRKAVAGLPEEIRADVAIEPSLPHDQWVEAMSAAPIGLVTMSPGAERVVMPSKAYSAMMAGQALLAICPEQSDLAETVRGLDCGWVVSPGEPGKLKDLLLAISDDPGMALKKGKAARQAGLEAFDTRAVATRWTELFERLRGSSVS